MLADNISGADFVYLEKAIIPPQNDIIFTIYYNPVDPLLITLYWSRIDYINLYLLASNIHTSSQSWVIFAFVN